MKTALKTVSLLFIAAAALSVNAAPTKVVQLEPVVVTAKRAVQTAQVRQLPTVTVVASRTQAVTQMAYAKQAAGNTRAA